MRFFLEQAYTLGDEPSLSAVDSRHLSRVLRARAGDEITVVSANRVFSAEILTVGETVTVRLNSELQAYTESALELILLQGLAKGERMEIVIQKAVELGVDKIIPVACERSVVRLAADKAAAKQARWQKIADAAAKQCGRTKLPQITQPMSMSAAIAALPADCRIIMPWEEADGDGVGVTMAAAMREPAPKAAALIIGPEGGLTAEEAALAEAAGARLVTLGKRILRTETAAIVGVTIVMYAWGDLGSERT